MKVFLSTIVTSIIVIILYYGMLVLIYKNVTKTSTFSQYYFNIVNHDVRFNKNEKYFDVYIVWFKYILMSSIILILEIVVTLYLDSKVIEIIISNSFINKIIDYTFIIVPMTIGIVVLFASLKKSYYIAFDITDINTTYKFKEKVIAMIILFFILVLNNLLINLPLNNNKIALRIYSVIEFIIIIYFSFTVLVDSFSIILTTNKNELKLLDRLYYKIRLCNKLWISQNICGVCDNLNYLWNNYYSKTTIFTNKHKNIQKVKFVDVTKNLNIKCLSLKSTLSNLYVVILGSVFYYYYDITKNKNFVNIIWVVIGLLIMLFSINCLLIKKNKKLKLLLIHTVYGCWGYKLINQNNIEYYFSLSGMPMYYKKEYRWLCSLLNIITFYKMALETGSIEKKVLKFMERVAKDNFDKDSNILFLLPYYLCCYFKYEKYEKLNSDIEKAELINNMQRLFKNKLNNKMLIQFAEAIITDINRETTNGNITNLTYQKFKKDVFTNKVSIILATH